MSASVSVTLHVVRIGLGTENLDDLLVPPGVSGRSCAEAGPMSLHSACCRPAGTLSSEAEYWTTFLNSAALQYHCSSVQYYYSPISEPPSS